MDPREFPTKGNLMLAKKLAGTCQSGYELMDKKRNILLKELMGLIDEAKRHPGRDRFHIYPGICVPAAR